jgi:hypothetical protein
VFECTAAVDAAVDADVDVDAATLIFV